MQRYTKTVSRWFRSLLIVSLFTATGAQAAEKIDLIIDTDPGADDVVALLFALASPEELNIADHRRWQRAPGQDLAQRPPGP